MLSLCTVLIFMFSTDFDGRSDALENHDNSTRMVSVMLQNMNICSCGVGLGRVWAPGTVVFNRLLPNRFDILFIQSNLTVY